MNYDETVKTLQTMLEIPLNQEDENFTRVLPRIVEYAENRIYREMDFLATTTAQAIGTFNPPYRELVVPPRVIVLRGINVFSPGGGFGYGTVRNSLERISIEAMDLFWPTQSNTFPGVPQRYCVIGDLAPATPGPPPTPETLSYRVRVFPAPDLPYTPEYVGTIRPLPLSPTNTSTFLSMTYPDLFCAACMVFASGYQRDFGAQADDPAKAMSWDGMYTSLRQGVMLEAARQKGEGAGWTALSPAPVSQPRVP
jgi:hypothetical protein